MDVWLPNPSRTTTSVPIKSTKLRKHWPSASCASGHDSPALYLRTVEKVHWTVPPVRAVLPTFSSRKEGRIDRYRAAAHRRAEADVDPPPQAEMARSFRNGAARL